MSNNTERKVTAKVLTSPWPKRLPVGTTIVETTPRPSKMKFDGSMWFVREDSALIFDEETDGKFRLLKGEFEIVNQ